MGGLYLCAGAGKTKATAHGPWPSHRAFLPRRGTALVAGHRPCATCRRKQYDAFLRCWATGNRSAPATPVAVKHVDATLQGERVRRCGVKPTRQANIDALPDGCMVDMDDTAYLIEGRKPTSTVSWRLRREAWKAGWEDGGSAHARIDCQPAEGRVCAGNSADGS